MRFSLKSRIGAFAAAGALALAMAPMAAFGVGPASVDTTISVTGIDDDPAAKVLAYKVVEVDQTNTATDGTGGWKLSGKYGNLKLTDILGTNSGGISATEAATIAKNVSGDSVELVKDKNTGAYTAKVEDAGLYVVLVTGTGATIYNPMFVGADFDANNGTNTVADDATYSGSAAIAKSSKPPVTKETVNASDKSFQIGDTIEFKIETTVPYYPAPYYDAKSTHFKVVDTLDSDLSFVEDTVKINQLTKDEDYKVSVSGQTMTIEFSTDYLQKAEREKTGAQDVVINYEAKVVNDAAKFTANVNERTNDVHLEYTNSPGEEGESDHVKTHHYTFGLDAGLAGSQSGTSKELRKVSVDATGNAQYETVNQSEWSSQTPLKGATFTLTGKSTDGVDYSKSFMTDEDGHITFTGLDADVDYVLKETVAPAGYQLDSTTHTIRITATYANGSDVLDSYTVKINGVVTATISVKNGADEEISTVTYSDDSKTALFKNVKAGLLPSTGGNGIFFYVFVGAGIMALAVVLARRYRNANRVKAAA